MATERILPAIASTAPAARAPSATARSTTPVARPVAMRGSEPFLTLHARAGILLGTSAAVYAVSLAAVAAFQSADDAAVASGRQPYLDAITVSRSRNDAIEASLAAVDARLRVLASAVDGASQDVTGYETNLDELATLVADVQGSTMALPSRIKLPSVSIRGPVASGGSRPRTTTTTRASGG